MNALILIAGIVSIVAALEIAKGAHLHELNIQHVKYSHLLADAVAKTDYADNNKKATIKTLLLEIRMQPVKCIAAVNFIEKAAMSLIGTRSAIDICHQDMRVADEALAALELCIKGLITPSEFSEIMKDTVAQFRDNSVAFEPLVKKTVNTILIVSISLITLKTVLISIIGWRISDSISKQYRRVTDAGKELSHRNEALERMSEMKSAFLANMSHEIRTPLNGMLGIAQIMRRDEAEPTRLKHIDTMISSGNSLLDIVNDVLDISKIEAGRIELDLQAFSVRSLVDQVKNTFEAVAEQKGLALDIKFQESANGFYRGDPMRLRQILTNLVGNAVKFTDEGRIVVHVRKRSDGMLRFCVIDTGPGIPNDQFKRVFARFQQADTSSTRAHGGAGLGLSISTEFVKLMKGEYGVKSQVGVGSAFWFAVPLEQTTMREEVDEKIIFHEQYYQTEPSRKLRVLISEDNPVNRMVAEATMSSAGYETTLSENGAEAIERLDCGDFDIVLMDIQMPVMAGDEAIRAIRSSGKNYANIPIIALTANVMDGAAAYYKEIGADDYVSKPIKFDLLVSKVKELTSERKEEPKSAEGHETTEAPALRNTA